MSRRAMMPMMMDSMGIVMLERAAEAGVKRAEGKEGDGYGNEQEVGHGSGG